MTWYFRPQQPGDTTRDPIASEFFSTEAIEDPANALVREAIQNALDAKRGKKVGVRIFLAAGRYAASSDTASRWLGGARPHLGAPRNGLQRVPDEDEDCPYLVLEDFGTTGLQGDIRQAFDEPGKRNPFFYFFRAEGRSDKSEGERGRWGIGKTVFPRSSQISTYFGYTVRADDDQRLIMGRCLLKSHKLAGVNYTPDGYFGEREGDEGLVLPVADGKRTAQFCRDFSLSRQTESGLSVVVPFIDPEITLNTLVEAVVGQYFWPILKGMLVVSVQVPGKDLMIDSAGLAAAMLSLPSESQATLAPLVALARWAISEAPGEEYRLRTCADDNPLWSNELIPDDLMTPMHADLAQGKNMAIRVAVQVRENGKSPATSYFGVYMCQDGHQKGTPTFVREGMILSDLKGVGRAPGVRSLVIVESGALSGLLGDSENPAHTQWQANSSHFKNKYAHGRNHISFVKGLVANVVSALSALDREADPSLFADIFSLPADNPEAVIRGLPSGNDEDDGDISPTAMPHLPRRQKEFRIAKARGGFRLGPGDAPIRAKARMRLQIAYDTRRGNPLRKYAPSDFVLDEPPIEVGKAARGLSIRRVDGNMAEIDISDPDFELVVTGFDEERDLIVRASFLEHGDDSAT